MQMTINLPDDFFDQALAESVAKIANKSQKDEFPPYMDKKRLLNFLDVVEVPLINGLNTSIFRLSKLIAFIDFRAKNWLFG